MSRKHAPCRALITNVDNVKEAFDYGDCLGREIAVERQIVKNPSLGDLVEAKDDGG